MSESTEYRGYAIVVSASAFWVGSIPFKTMAAARNHIRYLVKRDRQDSPNRGEELDPGQHPSPYVPEVQP